MNDHVSPIVAEAFRRLLYIIEAEQLCKARVRYPLQFCLGLAMVNVRRSLDHRFLHVRIHYPVDCLDGIDLASEQLQALILPSASCVELRGPESYPRLPDLMTWVLSLRICSSELADGIAGHAISIIEEGDE